MRGERRRGGGKWRRGERGGGGERKRKRGDTFAKPSTCGVTLVGRRRSPHCSSRVVVERNEKARQVAPKAKSERGKTLKQKERSNTILLIQDSKHSKGRFSSQSEVLLYQSSPCWWWGGGATAQENLAYTPQAVVIQWGHDATPPCVGEFPPVILSEKLLLLRT